MNSKELLMHARLSTLAFLLTACFLSSAAGAAEKTKDDLAVKNGMLVTVHYTLTGTDGKVIDTNKGRDPLKYIHGQRMMIPGFEKELTGMKKGAERKFTVKPEDAYGPINKNAFQEIPKDKLPANGLKVGAMLTGQGAQGQPMRARVHQIKEKTVVLDLNHPMAGKTLNFDVKVVDIQPAPPPAAAQPAAPAAPAKPAAPAQPVKPAEPARTK
ncbi:MAG: FKBP-type peptidyl-prolyl cis-trans isomerase, partial [Candidatus Binatia bacterium]